MARTARRRRRVVAARDGYRDAKTGRFVARPRGAPKYTRKGRGGVRYQDDEGRRISREAATRRANRRPRRSATPQVLVTAARRHGFKVRRSGRTCFIVYESRRGGAREYRVSAENPEWGDLDGLLRRMDEVAASPGVRSWFGAPRVWASVWYPKGYGPRGEDEYEVKVSRPFGLVPWRRNPPGLRLRIALLKLARKVEDSEGRVTVHRAEIVVCPDARSATRREYPGMSDKVLQAAERVQRGKGTAKDRELLARDYARRITRRKGVNP